MRSSFEGQVQEAFSNTESNTEIERAASMEGDNVKKDVAENWGDAGTLEKSEYSIADDNGDDVIDGNTLLPNKTFTINGVEYKTDNNGNICNVGGINVPKDGSESVDNTRELTESEKQKLKDTLGWNDYQIAKCTIGENGVIHYRTDRCDLEGKTNDKGIPYERKQVVIDGITIEGVFPEFESAYTTELSPDKYKSNTYATECNKQLKEAVQNDPGLRNKFTDEQLKDIEKNRTPTGYVWHHNETPGKMELVKRCDHDKTIGGAAHTGGNALWGPDSVCKLDKGESF